MNHTPDVSLSLHWLSGSPDDAVWENLSLWQRSSFQGLWLNISDHSTKLSFEAERSEISGVKSSCDEFSAKIIFPADLSAVCHLLLLQMSGCVSITLP